MQSYDGYIWVATLNGVAKFDGVRFTVFDKGNTPGMIFTYGSWRRSCRVASRPSMRCMRTSIRVVPPGSSWVNLCSNALMLRVVTRIGCAAVSFDGPTLSLQQLPGSRWSLQQADNAVAGQDSHVTLQGDGTACVQRITLTDNNGKFTTVVFKAVANGGVDLQLPLTQYQAGATRLSFSSMERNDRTNLR